ncbi:MAG: SusD/RagB family nutrient-binding outer membrane lipoprotein, partial [Cytophagaceae bacterium]|nr:SusD/RagB family nutrient-binding outer membrane lipoprotein [Cytophagaceae bacterium]
MAASLFTLAGCSDFGNINVNSNSPSTPSTSALFTGAIRTVGNMNGQVGPGSLNGTPTLYVQQLADVTYVEESRYKTVNFSYNGLYSGPLNNLNQVIKLNIDADTKTAAAAQGSNANQIAIARILKAYIFQWITDRWGDVPYSQALKGNENFSPAFDRQQDIYNDL